MTNRRIRSVSDDRCTARTWRCHPTTCVFLAARLCRQVLTLVIAFGPAVGVLVTTAGPASTRIAAQAATVPPWEPEKAGEEIGGLAFYDASGAPVTGGKITDPISTYVLAAAANPAHNGADTKATLEICVPQAGVDPGSWSCEAISASTQYPIAGAPAPIGTTSLPAVQIDPSDDTLQQFVTSGDLASPPTRPGTRTLTSCECSHRSRTYPEQDRKRGYRRYSAHRHRQ